VLFRSAVKYTDQGQVSLRLMAGEGRIGFEVADTGPGIAPEDQERIFQAFYQTPTGIARGEGTGLGLTISRELIRLMGGELRVASEPGQGTLFSFDLPLPAGVAPDGAEVQGRVLSLEPGQPQVRVLVAEDHGDSRELILRLLEAVGFAVQAVDNGRAAIELFQDWRPQFVWMDMRMPVLDGYTATRRIRALPGGREAKIVALTASAFQEDRDAIIAAGCDELVRKPLEEAQIFDTMGRLLGLEFRRAVGKPGASETGAETGVAIPDLAGLPAPLRGELRNAAEALDLDAMQGLIEQIRTEDPGLALGLRSLVDGFRFDLIVGLLADADAAARP
jgi:CheY-like chemotaxis protein